MDKYLIFRKSLGMILLLACAFACSDDPEPEPEPSVKELLEKNWEIVSVVREGQDMASSVYSIEFKSDGTFAFNTPGVTGLPQNGTWTYDLSRNTISLNSGSVELRIIGKVAKDKLEFEYVYSNHKMGDVEIVFRLK